MKFAVCIPTLNASAFWQDLWSGLERQSLKPSEVIVIDSASTDDTVELAVKSGCRVVSISRAEFRHGGTRQKAADELAANVDVVSYLTQDSILADANALNRLIEVFKDSSVGAAYGRQLPKPGATPIEAHARLFNYPAMSAIRSVESVDAMGFRAIFFSNSFGAYRKTALQQVGGFPRGSDFGEDTVVAALLLKSGWRIGYVANAMVQHSHAYSYSDEFRRYYKIGQLHGSEPWLLRDFGQASGEGRRFAVSEIQYLSKNAPWLIPDAMCRTGIKYLAYRYGRLSSQPNGLARTG